MEKINTLGIIGGLGPMATSYFMRLLTDMCSARKDQEHLDIITYSKPSIPDRTEFIIGKSKNNPVPMMTEVGIKLKTMGADALAIPCITAHCFHEELEEGIGLPIINAMEETAKYLKEIGIKCAGLMATDGTIESGVFKKYLDKYDIEVVTPKSQDLVMKIIYDEVKANKQVDMDIFTAVTDELTNMGAQVVLLGCTELSIVKRDYRVKTNVLDVLEILSRSVLLKAGKLSDKYIRL